MREAMYAVRVLRKQAGFTILALLTLALGIGAATVAFTVFDTVLLRPLPFEASDRLVYMQEETESHTLRPPSYPNFVDWRSQAQSFEGMASAMYPYSETVIALSEPVRATVMGVSQRFFRVLGVKPFVGREFTVEENQLGAGPVAMVSYEFWMSQMGGRQPLPDLRSGDDLVPVVGVLPPGFHFVQDADVFVPHERSPGTIRSSHNYMVVGRLSRSATLESARAEMQTVAGSLRATYGSETEAVKIRVTPLREYLVGNYRSMLAIVFAAAALVLLIACTNLVSAQLARGMARENEIAVRAALGASRPRLARQLLVESGVIAIAGAVLGTGFALLLTRVVRLLGAGLVPRLNELVVDGRVLLFVGVLAILTAILIGLYPAFRLSAGNPGDALRGAARGSQPSRRSRVWPLLVGFEIAMAVMLLIGSLLLIQTMRNILNSDPGFESHGLLTAALSPGHIELSDIDRLGGELSSVPGVQGAAFVNRFPLSWGTESGPVLRPDDPRDKWPALAGFRVVSANYFSVMREPLIMGRAFTENDRAGNSSVAIVTDGLAKTLWPGENPIGKPVRTNYLSTEWQTVVGVVREASSWNLARGSQHEIFVPLAQHVKSVQSQLIAVVRATDDPSGIAASVRSRLRDAAPAIPSRLESVDERIAQSAADRNFAMIAIAIFSGIALLLAGIGIYGVMSYSVAIRAHEIGVRIALGATPASLQAQVLGRASVMALGGIVSGIVLGSFAARYLSSILYGVNPFDPLANIAGAVTLLLTALLGAYVPARRSSRVDPLAAMRSNG